MRAHTLISILVGGGAVAVAGWGLAAPKPGAVFADKSPSAIPVDVELVIAVDVSYSMDPEEQALQREGYILGLTSASFSRRCAMAPTAASPSRISNGRANMTRESFCHGG